MHCQQLQDTEFPAQYCSSPGRNAFDPTVHGDSSVLLCISVGNWGMKRFNDLSMVPQLLNGRAPDGPREDLHWSPCSSPGHCMWLISRKLFYYTFCSSCSRSGINVALMPSRVFTVKGQLLLLLLLFSCGLLPLPPFFGYYHLEDISKYLKLWWPLFAWILSIFRYPKYHLASLFSHKAHFLK